MKPDLKSYLISLSHFNLQNLFKSKKSKNEFSKSPNKAPIFTQSDRVLTFTTLKNYPLKVIEILGKLKMSLYFECCTDEVH